MSSLGDAGGTGLQEARKARKSRQCNGDRLAYAAVVLLASKQAVQYQDGRTRRFPSVVVKIICEINASPARAGMKCACPFSSIESRPCWYPCSMLRVQEKRVERLSVSGPRAHRVGLTSQSFRRRAPGIFPSLDVISFLSSHQILSTFFYDYSLEPTNPRT